VTKVMVVIGHLSIVIHNSQLLNSIISN